MTASVKNASTQTPQTSGWASSSGSRHVENVDVIGFPVLPHSDSTTAAGGRQDKIARFSANGDIFQRVKDAVTMPEAAALYGYAPNRAGKIRCPFHSEKTPSFQLWNDHWYCFGACKEGGDVVRFVEKLFSLSPLDALKKLNADFNVGLTLDGHKATPEELEAAKRRREVRDAARRFENWRARAEWALSTAAGVGEAAKRDKTPEQWTAAECLAVVKMDYWDYLLERLYDGDESERMEILRDWPIIGAELAKAVSVNA